jgi:hypothetical protein
MFFFVFCHTNKILGCFIFCRTNKIFVETLTFSLVRVVYIFVLIALYGFDVTFSLVKACFTTRKKRSNGYGRAYFNHCVLIWKEADPRPRDHDYSFWPDVFCVWAAESLHIFRLFCHPLHYIAVTVYLVMGGQHWTDWSCVTTIEFIKFSRTARLHEVRIKGSSNNDKNLPVP